MVISHDRQEIIVLGAAGHGLVMAETIIRANMADFAGFLDDSAEKQAKGCYGFPVLGGLASWVEFPRASFLSSLYAAKKNLQYFDLIKSLQIPESRFATVIDPSVIVMAKTTIGPGSYIGAMTVIEPNSTIGRFCALLGSVHISHDTILEDYVACANSTSIAGRVSIGFATYIGANASIREYIKIGCRAVVGMGSVVVKDVPDDTIVVGNPARPLNRSV